MTDPSLVEQCLEESCEVKTRSLSDYESEQPRWCAGCGDHGVLTAVQRALRKNNVDPETVVAVSGIGCSSRLPHYLKTYGFHGIHGRALPIATGVRLARSDLHLLVVMGDGDCFSIGGNHWLHAIRYNLNAVVLVLDNEVYALTKMQASPTTPGGWTTNTTPRGTYLEALNPLAVVLGISNASFVAQTATWLPAHMDETLAKAWEHHGLSFIRVLQRCPVYMPRAFGEGGRNFPILLLDGEDGIPVSEGLKKRGTVQRHDCRDLDLARRVAQCTAPAPMGLLYRNPDVPTYDDIRTSQVQKPTRTEFLRRLDAEFDKYAVN